MSLEVKRNFLRYKQTIHRCVLEDEENNIKICVDLLEDDNEEDFDMYLMDENDNIGKKLSGDDETFKKYEEIVREMWWNSEIGENGEQI